MKIIRRWRSMTLKERIFRIIEREKWIREMKKGLQSEETSKTLTLIEDWEREIERRRAELLNKKSLEIQIDQAERELQEEEDYIKNLLNELQLETLEFDLGDVVVRATRIKEPTISIIRKKVDKNER